MMSPVWPGGGQRCWKRYSPVHATNRWCQRVVYGPETSRAVADLAVSTFALRLRLNSLTSFPPRLRGSHSVGKHEEFGLPELAIMVGG